MRHSSGISCSSGWSSSSPGNACGYVSGIAFGISSTATRAASISAPRSAPWKSSRISRELSPSTLSSEPRWMNTGVSGKPDHDLFAQHAHHFLDVARILRVHDRGSALPAPGREVVVLDLGLLGALEVRLQPPDDDRRQFGTRGLDVAARRQPEVAPDHVGLRDRQVIDLRREQQDHERAADRDAGDPDQPRPRTVGQRAWPRRPCAATSAACWSAGMPLASAQRFAAGITRHRDEQ